MRARIATKCYFIYYGALRTDHLSCDLMGLMARLMGRLETRETGTGVHVGRSERDRESVVETPMWRWMSACDCSPV